LILSVSIFRLIRHIISLFSYVVKQTTALIISHFTIFANSAKKGKYRSSARNSATRGKLWAVLNNGRTNQCLTNQHEKCITWHADWSIQWHILALESLGVMQLGGRAKTANAVTFYERKQLLLSARLSHRNSVHHTSGSVESGAS